MQLCDLSVSELVRLLRAREASAVEILESCLARVASVDGRSGSPDAGPITEEDTRKVHSFITLTPERARLQAQEVDRKLDIREQGEVGRHRGHGSQHHVEVLLHAELAHVA